MKELQLDRDELISSQLDSLLELNHNRILYGVDLVERFYAPIIINTITLLERQPAEVSQTHWTDILAIAQRLTVGNLSGEMAVELTIGDSNG